MSRTSEVPPATIHDMLFKGGQPDSSVALEDVTGRKITYGSLRRMVREMVGELNGAGFKRNDRIVLVLPNGLELAAVLVAITCGFTAVPLNPHYGILEFRTYLPRMNAKVLLIERGSDPSLKKATTDMGIEVQEILLKVEAGLIALADRGGSASPQEFALEGDDAIVLQTSGTTAVPKNVPLTQSNLMWGVHYSNETTRITSKDKGLILIPLFHLAGLLWLNKCILTGGVAICPPDFNTAKFFRWLDATQPTWYNATPVMHQSILERAKGNEDIISRSRLRFIRTASSNIPSRVLEELEKLFKAPVLEAYGSTEAGTITFVQYAGPGRPKGVGAPFGQEVAIMDENAKILPQGKHGEIIVRGPCVFKGYENDPEANTAAFVDGWFRTGDLGYMDKKGYLHLAGRVKEAINKGGEKVAPQEVDQALMEHPAVAEAAAFPVPHPTLGEDLDAAVVLKDGVQATERELRSFLFDRLAYFKVPTRILFVGEIPRNEMGKARRAEMAKVLGLT